eukprot:GHVS01077460.1.p1 GENE.GHVS01077460.1~~GHVS01077460.1.p1  ORF type:complete len:535 (+),score=73.99 GHVS01077460.1:139-1743(+)
MIFIQDDGRLPGGAPHADFREQQRAQCTRVCAILFLLLSTLFIVRLQQARYDQSRPHRPQHQKPRFQHPGKGGISSSEEAQAVLGEFSLGQLLSSGPSHEVVSLTHLHPDYSSSASFQASPSGICLSNVPFKTSSQSINRFLPPKIPPTASSSPLHSHSSPSVDTTPLTRPLTEVHAGAPLGLQHMSVQWALNSASSRPLDEHPAEHDSKSSASEGEIVSFFPDTVLYQKRELPGCPGPSHTKSCVVAFVRFPLSYCEHSSSWTCRAAPGMDGTATGLLSAMTGGTGLQHCVKIISGDSLSSIRSFAQSLSTKAADSRRNREGEKAGEVMSFCGNPLPQMIAVDGDSQRIHFGQPMYAVKVKRKGGRRLLEMDPSYKKVPPMWMMKPARGNKVEGEVEGKDKKLGLGSAFCMAIVDLRDYKDVSDCTPISRPSSAVKRYPIHLHFDRKQDTLAVFDFDVHQSLYVSLIHATQQKLLGSVKYPQFRSGWLLKSAAGKSSSLLIMGDEFPYAGTLNVLDLTTGRNQRLKLYRGFAG